jgi:CheY-like chemotaxis protein
MEPTADIAALRVLVTDDEPIMREYLATVASSMGCRVEKAGSGYQCLRRMEESPAPDVLFLDLVMPGLDGESVLREVRVRHPETQVIIVSVQDDEAAIRQLLAEGATAYLTKPVSSVAIASALAELAGSRFCGVKL